MTRTELFHLFDLEIRYICQRLGVPEAGTPEPSILLNGIAGANPEIHQRQLAFLSAYQAWQTFCEQLIGKGMQGKLCTADRQHLQTLAGYKDQTRRDLKTAPAALPAQVP